MKYFISTIKPNELFESDIQLCDIKECLKYFSDKEIIAVDTETTGFDPHSNKLITLQLGDKINQYVIDCNTIDIIVCKELLETKELILQNAKFDLRFLYKHNIWPNRVYDTYLAEVKLNMGIPNVRKNLQVLAEKYCNTIEVDKSLRGLIHKEGLSYTVINYAANDVKYLHIIKEKQLELAEKQGLTKDIYKENRFVPALAYTEYCGIYIDKEKWIKKYNKSKELLQKSKNTLDAFIIDNNLSKYIDQQLDLFSTNKKVLINWNSDQQVKPLFKELGLNLIVKEKGTEKESIEAGILLKQIDKHPIIPIYLEYKKWEKDCSTYGLSFLKHINKNTGRIHTNFTQVVDTGRMASGGKNKNTGEEYINLQNIPATPKKNQRVKGMIYARECIVPQESTEVFVNADYSGQEDIVFVNKSKEKKLIEFYQRPDNPDGHSYVAKLIFQEELKDISLENVKTERPDLRQNAKSGKFAMHYGGTGWTVSNNLNLSKEEGERIYNSYFKVFSDIKLYFDKCERDTIKKGYILIDDILGSKYYIAGYNKFIELHAKAKLNKLNKEDKSYYYRWLGNIKRNSYNYPIQGTSANITKIAAIHLYDWILKNNYQNIIKIVNIVHDEFLIECPKNISELISIKLKEFMEKAGELYCKIIPLKAVPEISTFWNH